MYAVTIQQPEVTQRTRQSASLRPALQHPWTATLVVGRRGQETAPERKTAPQRGPLRNVLSNLQLEPVKAMNPSIASPIQYDYSPLVAPADAPSFVCDRLLLREDLAWLAPRLSAARDELLADLENFKHGRKPAPEKEPLDIAFLDQPERLLGPERSLLERIQHAADRLAGAVDRVVVLGIGGSYMGARALFEACCHPYHNELLRKRRGGRPRIYFEGNNVDNDSVQGLLDLIEGEEDWALIVTSKSGGTLETAVAFRLLLGALRRALNDDEKLRSRVIPITGQSGRLRNLAQELGCADVFDIPDGVGGRYSIFTPVGLLPAAVLGLDVQRLLEGAQAINEQFTQAEPFHGLAADGPPPPSSNPALDYAGVGHLMERRRGATIRVLATWGKRLEAVGLWYDQLLAESLGKNGQGATPLTVVDTRDLHSRGQQHQQGRRDKLITNLYARRPERDVLAVETSVLDQDELNALAGKTLPEILDAAREGTNQAYADDHRPVPEIRLPAMNEYALGQLFQMLMLATAAEGRLIGINPFGQPGVEDYKRHMNARLRGE